MRVGEEGVRINTMVPRATRTERDIATRAHPGSINRIVTGRYLKPDYADGLMGVLVFLASDDSRFITGQVFNVDDDRGRYLD